MRIHRIVVRQQTLKDVSAFHRTEQRLGLAVARPVFAFAVLAGRVLPRAALLALGEVCSRAVFTLFPGVRSNLLENAFHILGPESTSGERRALAHQTLASFSRFIMEWVAPSYVPPGERIFDTATGKEHFLAALENGKGVIAMTLHMGNYELPGRELAALKRSVAVVFNRDRIGFLELLRARDRRAMHLDEIVIEDSRFFAIDALRRLEAGGIVLLAGDQVGAPDGREYTFLHGKARFSLWPARLAKTSGAPIVPAVCVRAADGSYRLEIAPRIMPRKDDTPEEIMQNVVTALERYLRRYPEQWLMVHRFWTEE